MFKCRCTRFGKYTISTLASKLEKITFSGNITQNILLPFPPSIPDTFIALTRLTGPKGSFYWGLRLVIYLFPWTLFKAFFSVHSRLFYPGSVLRLEGSLRWFTYDMIYVFRHFLKTASILEMLSIHISHITTIYYIECGVTHPILFSLLLIFPFTVMWRC